MCFNYPPGCSPDDYENSTVESEEEKEEDSYEPDISDYPEEDYEDWLLEKDQEYREWLFGSDQT